MAKKKSTGKTRQSPRRERSTRSTGRTPSSKLDRRWEHRFGQLETFKKKFGHCRVPTVYPPNQSLANWVAQQRFKKRQGSLAADRAGRLSKLGFCWELRHRRFGRHDADAMIAALAAFKKRYGHCDVPLHWRPNRELADWLRTMRTAKRSGTLTPKRVRQLSKLGFEWEPRQRQWRELYAALVEYKKEHRDCNVPVGWARNRKLAGWVTRVRRFKKAGRLPIEWVKRLDRIGFVWDCKRQWWETRYSELDKFRRKHGHCRVSTVSKTHAQLGRWVHAQRTARKQGKLSRERIHRLNRLGFDWEVLKGTRSAAS